MTTSDQKNLLTQQHSLVFDGSDGATLPTIQVDPNVEFQTMDGFGAAITGSSAYLINNKIKAQQREVLLDDLFTSEGIHLKFIRHTIGSSDFSVDENGDAASYTYNDIESGTDFELSQFSVGKDAGVIQLIKHIYTLNDTLKVLGTPWTAPGWMKFGQQQLNGWYLNYKDQRVYEAYADYFVKYIEEYKRLGIPIYGMTIQNEPEHTSQSYPSMSMNANEQAMFIRDYLGPAFANNDISTKIISYDHNWNKGMDYARTVLGDSKANAYTDGTAYHCYEGSPATMSEVHEAFPNKNIYFTECSGGEWSTNFGQNLSWFMSNLIIGASRNWAKTVLLWNMALDEDGGPTNGGCINCRGVVTINTENGSVTKNVEYYVLGHASKFVDSGAVRIASSNDKGNMETVAFKNPDDSIVLIGANTSQTEKSFQVNWDKKSFSYSMPSNSAATFKWAPSPD
ncbi:glycoside hydrolase family 30 protein [Aquibacillus rhizosphaerae]|uniref:Glycoside hydrolase family 30 beta sandwich domain-containing protein n=1 Tax=Aquibacillus rhizosphaerae TaxID=3051431 RepID=A0ABT7L2Y5_9BACI|nr:glycoside hydrolase family 30 beta sandwich domain-containing protein [Aquibacillus sp. LR5S19]MDL4840226.1 glycoside hydrolase family 30 beta sandwich domain-containing protein [Aquibacillus sp. LR5S19]